MIVEDNNLLDSMMNDLWSQRTEVDPFWKSYESTNVARLKNHGLSNFLNRPASFGNMGYTKVSKYPFLFRAINFVNTRFLKNGKSPFSPHIFDVESPERIRSTYGNFILQLMLENVQNADKLKLLDDSLIGNPQEKLRIWDKDYSFNFLKYFYRALVMDAYMNLSESEFFFEIGAGYGGQAEILLKLFPSLRICVSDIPPQLYVLEQFLKSAFPGEVLGYRDTKTLKRVDKEIFSNHRVIIIAPWDICKLEDRVFDSFTNQISFQEMSHDTVSTYCNELQRVVNKNICLFQQREGCGGVDSPVTRSDYIRLLPDFKLSEERSFETGSHLRGDPKAPIAHSDTYFFTRKVAEHRYP
jgi:putative sugar O-methyltransferase